LACLFVLGEKCGNMVVQFYVGMAGLHDVALAFPCG
jgi:hypothetical protein